MDAQVKVLNFDSPQHFFDHNKQFIYSSYYQHFYLIKISEQLYAGIHQLINAYNIVDNNGGNILCLHIDGAYMLYSDNWTADMLDLLSKQVDLKICTENFSFSGNKALIMQLFQQQNSTYKVFKNRVIYECVDLKNIKPVIGGDWELCTFRDFKRISQMIYQYHLEEYGDHAFRDYESVSKMVEGGIRSEAFFIWRDGRNICSVAQLFNEEAGYPFIGTLFTPINQRNKGYATALVYALTNLTMDEGFEKCGLVSDATNVSSNKVFQKVGYNPVYNYISMHTLNPSKLNT
jgi:predicted GNAT family acetyltransferase